MSFSLTGRPDGATSQGVLGASGKLLPALHEAGSEASEASETAPLSPDDLSRLRCEGRTAAFLGLSLRACPYSGATRAEREAWMEGYNTVK